jgi:hypothetical protein
VDKARGGSSRGAFYACARRIHHPLEVGFDAGRWMRCAYPPYGDQVSGMSELSFELDPLDSFGRDAPPILWVPSPCD